MGNDIEPTGQTQAPATKWSEPSLPTSLVAMLEVSSLWTGDEPLPLLNVDELAAARSALAIYRGAPRGSSPGRVGKMMGTLAVVLPTARLSPSETDLRLSAYQRQLADIDADVLAQAFHEAANTCKWFPTIAELREIASKLPAPPRVVRAYRLRRLLEQAERGVDHLRRADEPPLTLESMRAIRAEFRLDADDPSEVAAGTAAKLARPVSVATKREPTPEEAAEIKRILEAAWAPKAPPPPPKPRYSDEEVARFRREHFGDEGGRRSAAGR